MFPNRHKQQGNMLVVAIFVIVVMGFLASSLTRINWSNSNNLTRETARYTGMAYRSICK